MPTLKLAKFKGKPEIFHTLQGEGVNTGVPAVFIRSSLCNLHCQWCDTDYTWNWEKTPWKHENDSKPGYKKFKKTEYIIEPTHTEIAEEILKYQCANLVITGGEPLLQQEAFCELLELLKLSTPHLHSEVETNGTQIPTEKFDTLVDQYNVSPKLANSGNSESLRIKPDALHYFAKSNKAWFKFVISSELEIDEITHLIKTYSIPSNKVILMPEGRTIDSLNRKRLFVADICKQQGFRFGDRMHIQLWGEKRGV